MSIKNLLFLIIFNISLIYSIRLVDNDFFTPQTINLVRKLNRLAISPENIPVMNILAERLRNYVKYHKYEKERKECPYEKFINIFELRKNFTADEDGTYDIYTHERIEFNSGYQVSFETLYDDYSPQDYTDLCYMMSLISDNQVYLGYWGGSGEFSFHFDDLDLAYDMAIVFKQLAIYDWAKRGDINNPYAGELPS